MLNPCAVRTYHSFSAVQWCTFRDGRFAARSNITLKISLNNSFKTIRHVCSEEAGPSHTLFVCTAVDEPSVIVNTVNVEGSKSTKLMRRR